jgi:CRP-like cAMP-binding protein
MDLKICKGACGCCLERALSEMPIFEGLNEASIKVLAGAAMRIHFRAGQRIFHQGELANRFFLIEKGKVCLVDETNSAEPSRFAMLGPKNVLGWSWLFPPHNWKFTASAVVETDAIFFYGTQLLETFEADPRLGYELMKRFSSVIVQRLQSARAELITIKRELDQFKGASFEIGSNAG